MEFALANNMPANLRLRTLGPGHRLHGPAVPAMPERMFDALWYLPVLATASALALGVVRLLARGRWSVAAAAGVHPALIACVIAFLLLGFDAPQLPLLLVPAALLDLADGRGAGIIPRATLCVGALYAVYVPVLDGLGEGVEIDPGDVLLGLPIALVGVSLAFAALLAGTAPRRARTVSPALAGALGLTLLLAAGPAAAHDPGQGADAGVAALDARLEGRVVRLGARLLRSDCARFGSGAMIARRSGREPRWNADAAASAATFVSTSAAAGFSTPRFAAAVRRSRPGSRSRWTEARPGSARPVATPTPPRSRPPQHPRPSRPAVSTR